MNRLPMILFAGAVSSMFAGPARADATFDRKAVV